MYTSIEELPSQVTTSLDTRDATKWMSVYNATLGKNTGKAAIKKARKAAWQAVKDSPSALSFYIIASADVVDRDKERVVLDKIKAHMDDYIDHGGQIQNWHRNYNIGVIWDWDETEVEGHPAIGVWGNLYGGSPVYSKAREEFLDGNNSMSVAGPVVPKGYKCDKKGCYMELDMVQIMEISLCPVPANPLATLQWHNRMDIKKSSEDDGMTLQVSKVTVHKDYTLCPIQHLKKSFLDEGYTDVHARDYGVHIGFGQAEIEQARKDLTSKGWYAVPDGDGLFVNRRDDLIKALFKDCYSTGRIDAQGYFTDMDREMFGRIHRLGLYDVDEGLFRLSRPSTGLNTSEEVSDP